MKSGSKVGGVGAIATILAGAGGDETPSFSMTTGSSTMTLAADESSPGPWPEKPTTLLPDDDTMKAGVVAAMAT